MSTSQAVHLPAAGEFDVADTADFAETDTEFLGGLMKKAGGLASKAMSAAGPMLGNMAKGALGGGAPPPNTSAQPIGCCPRCQKEPPEQ